MTKTYKFVATIEIRVEADTKEDARGLAEEIAEEMNATVPVGATFVHDAGHVHVKFIAIE